MIYYLVTEKHKYTMRRFLQGWGKSITPLVRILPYEQTRQYLRGGSLGRRMTRGSLRRLVNAFYDVQSAPRPAATRTRPPTGHWIFSDIERLTPREREEAALFRDGLIEAGAAGSLHNDPLATMGRYELLRTLHERGINDFDAYRLTEARRPARFPVFLRTEDDHAGAETGLLENEDALDAALEQLARSGKSRAQRIAVEFHAERDARGLYRKYAAWRIGGQVFPGHLFFDSDWMLKEPRVVDDEALAAELAYFDENPHERALEEAFRIARVDYGRVDYGIVDGRVQIYEINTNPGIPSAPAPGPGARRAELDRRFNKQILERLERLECLGAPGVGAPPTRAPGPGDR